MPNHDHATRGFNPFADDGDDYAAPGNDASTEQLAAFVQEYVRRENQPDAGPVAVIASGMRDPMWLPHQVAERLLAKPEIQAAIKALRTVYRPAEMKEVSVDSVSADLEQVYQEAKDARQFTAAIAAKKVQAELHKLINKDVNVNVRHTVGNMSDADLEAIAKRAPIDAEFTEVKTGLPAVNG